MKNKKKSNTSKKSYSKKGISKKSNDSLINKKEEENEKLEMIEISNLLCSLNKHLISEKCIIYIRCSSKKQNSNEDHLHGSTTQRQLCMDYAKEKGFEIVEIIDEVGSAINDNIKRLRLWNLYKEYEKIHFIMVDPSRLSRNIVNGVQLLQHFYDHGFIIHSVRDNVSSDSYNGRNNILLSINQAYYDSETMKKRLNSTIKLKKKNGSKFGRAPFGYKNIRSVNPITNYPITTHAEWEEEKKTIELIKKMYFGSDMESFYAIFRKLSNNPDYIILYDGIEYQNICFGYFYYEDIAEKLNENNIFKRNYPWNKNSIKAIIKNIKETTDQDTLLYFTDKYGYLTIKQNNKINNQVNINDSII